MVPIGILGGTFNPPHLGHTAVARCALAALPVGRVVLMPARTPPHKEHEQDPGAEHRLQMCRLAVADLAGIEACALELERDGPSYTVDTLRAINASDPDAELTFIVGADTASTLASWREPEALLELADLAVVTRAGASQQGVLETIAELRGASTVKPAAAPSRSVRFLEMEPVAISSSAARERAARGEPLEALVGAAVADYIVEHRLYRAQGGG